MAADEYVKSGVQQTNPDPVELPDNTADIQETIAYASELMRMCMKKSLHEPMISYVAAIREQTKKTGRAYWF
ncbi:hypothetical protein OSTOST_25119 [Ostertagia ostertagi]